MIKHAKSLILSLETSTRIGSVAILRAETVLAEKAGGDKSSNSEQLLSDVSEILQTSGVDLKQINLLAVAIGPGSFTGLRIGLSTAKGLAKALKIPLAGISTLEATAACSKKDGEISVALPAGRNEFYIQTFNKFPVDVLEPISPIEIINNNNLSEIAAANEDFNWISTAEIISLLPKTDKIWYQNLQILSSNLAVSVGRIAYKIQLCGRLNEHPPFPVYVRGPDIGSHKNAK